MVLAVGCAVCGQGAQPSRASARAAPQVLAPHQQSEGGAVPGRAGRDPGNDSGLCSCVHVTQCVFGLGTVCTDVICMCLQSLAWYMLYPYADGHCKRHDIKHGAFIV